MAEELDQSGAPVTSTTICSAATRAACRSACTCPQTGLTLGPGAPSCPILWGSTLQTTPCSYSSSYVLLANVQDVVNNPSAVAADGTTPTQPIFTYGFFDPGGTYNSIPTRTTPSR